MRSICFLSCALVSFVGLASAQAQLQSVGNETGFLEVPGGDYDWFVVEPYGTVLKRYVWTDKVIPVCWDEAPADQRDSRMRGLVRSAVINSWQRYADIEFTGWGECASPRAPGVHIVVRDTLPVTRGLGKYLNHRPGGVTLNFNMSNWQSSCQPALAHDTCVQFLAVHEFGHVLGFVHEHVRGDSPAECRAEVGTRGARGNWRVTTYDPNSIMNYCSSAWTLYSKAVQDPSVLSEPLSSKDRAAVKKVYGERRVALTHSMETES